MPAGTVLKQEQCLTVSQLNKRIKSLLEAASFLQDVMVTGEISNFKHHSSGHMYFTLKDERSRLRCVMFRARSAQVRFKLEDGLTVIVRGAIGVYETSGDYQLYVDDIYPTGQGALYLAFEQLKEKLEKEGLFDQARKRPLPFLPKVVGVITSPTGAAIRDVISVLKRRNPAVEILLAPALVQGEGGPDSVVAAIKLMNRAAKADVLIVGRGGGSLEELWTFNEEAVARAIATSQIPVVSAVGHETDFTIADFVADRRAPTPSAAAELVVPEQAQLMCQVEEAGRRMKTALSRTVVLRRDRLRLVAAGPALTRPKDRINQARLRVDELLRVAESEIKQQTGQSSTRLEGMAGKLHSLSPLATLARGYAICQLAATKVVVRSITQAPAGSRLLVQVSDGVIRCRAEERTNQVEQAALPL